MLANTDLQKLLMEGFKDAEKRISDSSKQTVQERIADVIFDITGGPSGAILRANPSQLLWHDANTSPCYDSDTERLKSLPEQTGTQSSNTTSCSQTAAVVQTSEKRPFQKQQLCCRRNVIHRPKKRCVFGFPKNWLLVQTEALFTGTR
ncbi:hypothetical protein CEXT_540431 [Caerostris extrusa]|uniref:Uncharacterized protein n=1 Tax=Caerostris extrusa TaxID=172846 RepID=A0AAV4VQY3_CAEEX|nr:hypothetical protein CEXT_540431 [Caerostris extrusa]